jgi:phenylalanyl-tRNA synthetase beta chain
MAGSSTAKPKVIRLLLQEVERLLGVRMPAAKIKSMLLALGCQVSVIKTLFAVKPPTWRLDLSLPADLIEEVGRMSDYNTLPRTLPVREQRPNPQPLLYRLQEDVRDRLVSAGLTEVSTYSFYGKNLAEQFDLADQPHIRVANPLNPEQALLRRSLMPLLLSVAGQQSSQREQLSIFEIGRAFWPRQSSSGLPDDRLMLGMVWVAKAGDPFLNLKGTIGDLFHNLGIQDARIVPSTSRSARIVVGTEPVGIIGWVGERYARAAKLRRPAAFCEIDCSLLSTQPKQIVKVKSLPLYPSVERDLAFVLPKPVPHHELVRAIRGIDPLILNVQGFDRYRLPDGRTSIAMRLTFQSPGKTLTGSEVQDIVDRVTGAVKSSFQAEIRS